MLTCDLFAAANLPVDEPFFKIFVNNDPFWQITRILLFYWAHTV